MEAKVGSGSRDSVVDRAIELAFSQLRLGRHATADQVEEVVRLVGEGALDAVIEAQAQAVGAAAPKRRFDSQQVFSYEDWKKRHHLD